MSDFKYNKKDSYSQEDIDALLSQKDAYDRKNQLDRRDEELKAYEQKLLEKERENILLQVPNEKNRPVIKSLLDSGMTYETVKSQFPHLVEKPLTGNPNLGAILGVTNEQKAPDEDPDVVFASKVEKQGAATKDELAHYMKVKGLDKIK